MSTKVEKIEIPFHEQTLEGLLLRPKGSRWLFVMAHGAGAGMHHPLLEDISRQLAEIGISTLRFNFPYMQRGRRLPDREPELLSALESVWIWAQHHAPEVAVIVGGKSMGGRMSSILVSRGGWDWVRGLVFLGFPLHPAKKPAITRADHLRDVHKPMLFLQGTRDLLAEPKLMDQVYSKLGPKARVHYVTGADHSFEVLRRLGRSSEEVKSELCGEIARFCQTMDNSCS